MWNLWSSQGWALRTGKKYGIEFWGGCTAGAELISICWWNIPHDDIAALLPTVRYQFLLVAINFSLKVFLDKSDRRLVSLLRSIHAAALTFIFIKSICRRSILNHLSSQRRPFSDVNGAWTEPSCPLNKCARGSICKRPCGPEHFYLKERPICFSQADRWQQANRPAIGFIMFQLWYVPAVLWLFDMDTNNWRFKSSSDYKTIQGRQMVPFYVHIHIRKDWHTVINVSLELFR